MRLRFEIAAAVVLGVMPIPAAEAHEFWLDGTVGRAGGLPVLELDLKVGQRLDGISLPFVSDNVDRFDWIAGGQGPITGTLGDVPAAVVPYDPGRAVAVFHRTRPRRLVHDDWDRFLSYLDMEGLDRIERAHLARGLPRTGFAETYTRHAKLAVLPPGGGTTGDRHQGSPVEIVLDRAERAAGHVRLAGRVVAAGVPLPGRMTVFLAAAGGTEVRRLPVAAEGGFEIDLEAEGTILLNAVSMTPVAAPDAAWHSDWASLVVKFAAD